MKSRRFLLVTKALGSASLLLACKKEDLVDPLPGNPKGSFYDGGSAQQPKPEPSLTGEPLPANPKGSHYDAGFEAVDPTPPPPPPPPPSATQGRHNMPANPKGSHYDAGSPLGRSPKK